MVDLTSPRAWRDATRPPDFEWQHRGIAFVAEANGWTYLIEANGDWNDPGSGANWNVMPFEPGRDPIASPYLKRGASFLDNRGIPRRGFKIHPSFEAARRVAALHAQTIGTRIARGPLTPAQLANELTPDERRFIMEAVAEGGQVPPEFGTRSERSIRARQTRILRRLEPLGVFRGIALTPLGFDVARVIEED